MRMRTVRRRARRLADPQLIAAACIALAVEIGLRVSTVPRLAEVLGIRLGVYSQLDPPRTAAASRLPVAWMAPRSVAVRRLFTRWPFGDTCLRRALVLGQRLRRLDPVLVIGVRHDDGGRLAAHAWLVVDGVALDPLAAQYLPLQEAW